MYLFEPLGSFDKTQSEPSGLATTSDAEPGTCVQLVDEIVSIVFALPAGDTIALAAKADVCVIGAGMTEPGETDSGFVNGIGGAIANMPLAPLLEAGRTLFAPLHATRTAMQQSNASVALERTVFDFFKESAAAPF